jgi:hypothetical protein
MSALASPLSRNATIGQVAIAVLASRSVEWPLGAIRKID